MQIYARFGEILQNAVVKNYYSPMEKRLQAFIELGNYLRAYLAGTSDKNYQSIDELVDTYFHYNGWFNRDNVLKALSGIAYMLRKDDLIHFAKQVKYAKKPRTVAVIMAGNIPAVGFHDMLCVLLSGNNILIKLSSDDTLLIPFLVKKLAEFDSTIELQVRYSEGKLERFDAVIATGSDNSARYFAHYFGRFPHIIRKNRTSVAILTGKETPEDLHSLGHDVFDFFGLGCRSVSKVYVPAGYKPDTLFEGLFPFNYIIENKKYANNYEYNRAIYLLNKEPFLDNNFLLIKYSKELHSPVGVLFLEEYTDFDSLRRQLGEAEHEIQCVVTNSDFPNEKVALGQTQCPGISTFADNVNTIAFLNNLE